MKLDPLKQFALKIIIPLKIWDIDISLTNSSLFMLGTTFFIILSFQIILKSAKTKTPSIAQGIIEFLFSFTKKLSQENIGKDHIIYLPLTFSLFLFLLVGNIIGLFPFAFTFTSHLIITFALALLVFLLSIAVSIKKFGFGFFSRFIPSGTPIALMPVIIPIEVLSFLFRPISLSMRLFANIVAGHIILKVFASFIFPLFNGIPTFLNSKGLLGNIIGALAAILPLIANVMFLGLEFLVALIQAYIFTVISCIYIRDSIEAH